MQRPFGQWAGETICIAASGPSIRKEQIEHCRGKCRVLTINNTFQLAPWADAHYATDRSWWKRYGDQLSSEQQKWCSDEWVQAAYKAHKISVRHGSGLCIRLGEVNSGLNSGYQAVNLAFHLGVKKIILLGYDFQYTDGKSHWHGDHGKGLNNPDNIGGWIKYWWPMAEDLQSYGVEVVNCTTQTALTQFRRASIYEEVD